MSKQIDKVIRDRKPNINETEKCVCPKGTIKYAVFIKDKNNNKLCSVCKKIEI